MRDLMRQYRGKRSQEWLAKQTGNSLNTIQKIESDQQLPSVLTAIKIVSALGLSPEYVVRIWTEPPYVNTNPRKGRTRGFHAVE